MHPGTDAAGSRIDRRIGGVSATLTRAGIAVGLLATPIFEERFGSVALPLMCVGLAITTALIAAGMRSSTRTLAWTQPATDTITLLIVVPVAAIASSIELADARLGGGSGYFAAASAATLGATAIVALSAASLHTQSRSRHAISVLPTPLIVAAVIAGADRFSAGTLTQGLAISWLVAAAVTAIDVYSDDQVGALLAPLAFAAFVVIVLVVARAEPASQSTATKSALALVTTAIAGVTLLWNPPGISGRSD